MQLRIFAAIVFFIGLTIWTWLLIEPKPVPETVMELLSASDWLKFILAKLLHAAGYACLTLTLGIWLPARRMPLLLGITFMILHGVATEIIQTYVERHGCIRDVLIDWFGIAVGVWIGRKFWRPMWSANRYFSQTSISARSP